MTVIAASWETGKDTSKSTILVEDKGVTATIKVEGTNDLLNTIISKIDELKN